MEREKRIEQGFMFAIHSTAVIECGCGASQYVRQFESLEMGGEREGEIRLTTVCGSCGNRAVRWIDADDDWRRGYDIGFGLRRLERPANERERMGFTVGAVARFERDGTPYTVKPDPRLER
jgi:hypothetical protein